MGKRDYATFGYENNEPDNAPDFDQYEGGCEDAHHEFCEGVQETEGVITTHDPQTAPYQLPHGFGAVESDEIDYNPPVVTGMPRRRY